MKNLVLTGTIVVLVITVSALLINARYLEVPDVEVVDGLLSSAAGKPGKTLKAFKSQKELEKFLREFAKRAQRKRDANKSVDSSPTATAEKSEATGADSDSITNNQHAGVDEGGIVKLHGDHLVILRRGRLFTVRIEWSQSKGSEIAAEAIPTFLLSLTC